MAATVVRLQARLSATQPARDTDALLEQLAERLRKTNGPAPLRWIRASVGQALRLVAVDEIDFLRSEDKYTLVAWRGDAGKPGEALVRTPLKELLAQLDPAHFVQVHRSVVVNLRARQSRRSRRERNGDRSPEGSRRCAAGQPHATCTTSGRCESIPRYASASARWFSLIASQAFEVRQGAGDLQNALAGAG